MPGTDLPVLLVEDNPGDALLIREMLAEGGDERFRLTHAPRLQDGLYRSVGAEWSAVLLDLSLPDSAGLETLRRFRERCAAPVVVLTSTDDGQLALEALRHGAQDFLVKGQVDAKHLAHALHFAISRHHAQSRLVQDHLQNEQELRMARRIQQGLFPKRPPELPGFTVHAACHPAAEAGGDFFDYLRMTDGSWSLVVGDVTHHGVGPALLMASTRAYLRAFAHAGCNLGEMMSQANLLLHADVGESMVPLVLVHIDPINRRLHYLNAGHRPGYVLDKFGQVRQELLTTDVALGLYPDGPFRCSAAAPLSPGDVVLVATDGVHEADGDEGRFGTERLLAFARRHIADGPERLVEGLYQEVRRFEGGRPQNDDITVLAAQALAQV